MGWKNWPSWAKGGIFGLITIGFLFLIPLILGIICFINQDIAQDACVILGGFIYFGIINYFSFTAIIILGFIIGALIGLVVGKTKSKNKKAQI